jgi:D-glycero-alpha-D-manno-heptose-7-phosphate kinase|tara:strand:+ start:3587 stop:4579 length:993 start_codon:yes stop_codon:yes gene_type:complete
MIISKTPLRISFAGGGTDLPSFYRYNEYGAVLSTSINKYIYVIIKEHSLLFPERFRFNYSETEQVDNIDKIKNPIIRECLKFLNIDEKLYICTVADAPGSSGLGSSSTFCVGLLNALYFYKGEVVSRGRLAEEAAYIEIEVLGRPMGKQDHYAAAFGGLNFIKFHADEKASILPILGYKEIDSLLFQSLLTMWTGTERPSGSILSEQDKNSKKNCNVLLRMRAQAEQMYEMLNERDIIMENFGRLINKGWKLKRTLASNISNSSIDDAYETAMNLGAFGGKISGAGGGGFLNIIVPVDKSKVIADALIAKGMTPFKVAMDTSGTTVNRIN